MQSGEEDHAGQVAQLQQQVQDFEQQQALLQAQLAVQPKPEELHRQGFTWLHLNVCDCHGLLWTLHMHAYS